MKNYEKPVVEIVDFNAEVIMSGGVGDGFSMGEGNEPI